MLKSLKNKLIISFAAITSLSFIVIIGNELYNNRKNNIDKIVSELNQAHIHHLNTVNLFRDFMFIDAQKNEYYETKKSINLQAQDSLLKQTKLSVQSILSSSDINVLEINEELIHVNNLIDSFQNITSQISNLIVLKGFKDYGNTGMMREHAHNIENVKSFPLEYILMLRRNEKDYIIREESKYSDSFIKNHAKYMLFISNSSSLGAETKSYLTEEMEKYIFHFRQLVFYTQKIGDKSNSGLFKKLNQTTSAIQTKFNQINSKAEQSKKNFFSRLRLYYLILLLIIITLSLVAGYILAVKITKPISLLSESMNDFVKSNFTKKKMHTIETTTLEIEKLVSNYKALKNEIIDKIENFKEKVEERTNEINSQNKMLKRQKNEAELINKNIITGLTYAKYIQGSLLPSIEFFTELFPESFILHQAKDIVSGDFYWAKRFINIEGEDLSVVAVADATGHGVSGALMSMLGITFLNDITPRTNIQHASEVLTNLRKAITDTLNQKENKNRINNGIDIGLFVINNRTLRLEFAGANRFVWVIRGEEVFELKGDNLPIGGYETEKFYNDFELQLKKGDNIYLFTDGYADQFGGVDNRKFMKSQLKSLLIENCNQKPEKQKQVLEETLEQWKGKIEQTDDILIIGIKI
jgi:serine phosphatase RsbU (regulator of sigma subunit)